MTKTTILLIRHGETDWNAEGRWQGHSDIPLNENGRQQARALARRLAAWPIEAVYSSDLKRASETAEIIAAPLELTPILKTDLRERYSGFFQGLNGNDIRANYAEEWQKLITGGEVEGVESNHDVQERMWRFFETVSAEHNGRMIALVSHGAALGMLIAQALGFTPGQRPRFTMRRNTGLSIIELNEVGPVITLLNDAAHLDPW